MSDQGAQGRAARREEELETCRAAGLEPPAAVPSKRCRACGWPMPASASRCKECDGFQDWRRHLSFSATTLSLLVALVSVSAYAAPLLGKALSPPADDLHVQLVSCSNAEAVVQLAVSNLGERAGAVRTVTIQRDLGDGGEAWTLELTDRFAVIEPGSVQQLTFYSPRGLPNLQQVLLDDEAAGEDTWTLTVTTVRFEGGEGRHSLRFREGSQPALAPVGAPYPVLSVEEPWFYRFPEGATESEAATADDLPGEDLYLDITLRAPPGMPVEVGCEYALVNGERVEEFWVQWTEAEGSYLDTVAVRGVERYGIAIPIPATVSADPDGQLLVTLHDFADTELARLRVQLPQER